MHKSLFALAGLALLLTGCADTALPLQDVGPFKDDPHVQILSPAAGATVNGGDVAVKLAVTGRFKIIPAAAATNPHVYGEGHYHLFLDVTPTPAGEPIPKITGIYHVATNDFVLTGVASGHHTLWVELGFSDHIPYQQTLTKVDFTVSGGSPTGGGTPNPTPSEAPSPAPSAAPTAAVPSPATTAGPVAATVQLVTDPNNGGAFKPPSVSIKVGEAVKWDWVDDSAQHSVTADDGSFDSGLAGKGNSFSFTFATAGTYTYHCSVHPLMVGKITVS
ncbi:MAG TPA: plastocyanin/azurin family copper-binding protein [Candidatus Dormibacteraeota bacterium]|nr:plastocyanin/azurin family copper-binding protein [Candidatus Dormibacteraeota bacterium]